MKKVVVAEASPTIKSVADSLLRQNGYDVICTSDGLQAWDVIMAEKPDLVLVGHGLSGISGLDLCRQITTDRITGGIPVVLMTGAKDAITEEQILNSGARGKLRKPFSPKDLLDVAERLAGHVTASAPAPSELPTRHDNRFSTQVSSSDHLQEKKEPYNLEWLDLNDNEITKVMPKVTSFDISGDDQGLVIDEDQYGLSNPQSEPEPEASVPIESMQKDEDYEWFLDEMKREMESKGKVEHTGGADATAPSIMTAKPAPDPLKFDDIASAKEAHHPVANIRPRENGPIAPPPFLAQANSLSDTKIVAESRPAALSQNDLSNLADLVATRLAAQIAARIDRSQIIEAIKAALKQ